jgi:hypothetical protein
LQPSERFQQFDEIWKQTCKDARIGVWHFSYFRGSAVGNRERAGIPVPVVMNLSGRKTRPVFDRYAIVDEKDLQAAANRQPAYFEISAINSSITRKNIHATV